MNELLEKKVNVLKDGKTIFSGILKQSLTLECYVIIDNKDDNNRFVIFKNDEEHELTLM